jgi:gliding motility-associated-like protein
MFYIRNWILESPNKRIGNKYLRKFVLQGLNVLKVSHPLVFFVKEMFQNKQNHNSCHFLGIELDSILNNTYLRGMQRYSINIMKIASIIALLFFVAVAHATHNRAGEITYAQIADLTLRITITTYTKASSVAADRDSLDLLFGDGNSRRVGRSNGPGNRGENIGNDIKKNIYVTTYTYSGPGTYTISMTDPNRNGGILNVNPPSSENVQFHLETTVVFLNPLFEGYNNSPILLNPPIEIGCVGQIFTHNPNAFDPDFDSLSYELIVPLQDRNLPVPNYSFPNEIAPGANNMISLNSRTGDFIWNSPQRAGEYNITILIREFRNGRQIGSVIRDLQILILECDNRPPRIESVDEICVVAGELIRISVIGLDPDMGQRVRMESTGGPFQQASNPARFIVNDGYQLSPLNAIFEWQTDCSHISDGFYNVLIKAEDNFFGNTGLSSLKTIRVKVTGPEPLDTRAENLGDQVRITWQNPYTCQSPPNNIFQGFAIYRRNSSNAFLPDTCNPGMEGRGYTLIAQNINSIQDNRYAFVDPNAEKGKIYCYRVVGVFARRTTAGFPINRTEGLPGKEVCIQLNRDIPFITNVSIEKTDTQSGKILIKWTKPYLPDFDTLENPGPYRFEVFRSAGINTDQFILLPEGIFTATDYGTITDTTMIDSFAVNTVNNAYTYKINFYTEGNRFYGASLSATSTFLRIVSTDRRNILSWANFTPWENYNYHILRLNEQSAQFEPIGSTNQLTYTDRGLQNEKVYCYKVEAEGSYGIPGIDDPLFNFSQELCGSPIDTVPPCAPTLIVTNDCDKVDSETGFDALINKLIWNDVTRSCEDAEDTEGYHLYYKAAPGLQFERIQTLRPASDTMSTHRSLIGLAGCYAIRSFDINGNESLFSNIICVDNCPVYLLPNTFTPNNDGKNDLFIPRANRYIARVEFKVFNIWGNLVFETTDPEINWSGRTMQGSELAEGTYYYTCRIFENRLEGIVQQNSILTGFIELIR